MLPIWLCSKICNFYIILFYFILLYFRPPRSIEANPYASMIDFTDLFRGHNNFDVAQIELNV